MRIEGWNGEIGDPRWWARALGFAAVLGILLGVIGPFGSYLNPLPLRIFDYVATMLAGTVLAGFLIPLQLRVGLKLRLPRLFVLAIGIATTAAPISVLSAMVAHSLWPAHVNNFGAVDWYFQAVLVEGSVVALWLIFETARHVWETAAPANPKPPTSAARDGGAAICLQMEDNYVRVHRDSGSSLELMPLHEAIKRYGQTEGLQVHRSWWVAAAAVDGAERDLRNWRLRLANGLRVPVARNRIAAVRARGWIIEP
ncbi:LytTR family DNA-binding domain-containing protein [Methylocapsa sp. S129]|uniref:LytTR family DNA-binding domain-containing protein n=1 Tax=Methylocapsa sp. S129 TaxID=1641869 RepID=UPI00131C87C8|nr:LytTR family DNA-binding domain-containing protein [Methylocapsa sp. S129]